MGRTRAGHAMKALNLASLGLRLRVAASALGPVATTGLVVLLLSALALGWLVPRRLALADQNRVALAAAALPPPAVKTIAPPATANDNLELFYHSLGERRYAEQQVRTLFGLAAKTGLTLRQGEYKSGYERAAGVATYQIMLPVKGSYKAVWQFAMLALSSIPFASLDDISFKREAIGDAAVEARLRFTLYLTPGGQP